MKKFILNLCICLGLVLVTYPGVVQAVQTGGGGVDNDTIFMGNVGIGTTEPNSLLSIASSTASGTSKLFSVASSTELLTVLANGNVGIGTMSPGAPLQVHNAGYTSLTISSERGLASNGNLGSLNFLGKNSANEDTYYSTIVGTVQNFNDGVESGELRVNVMNDGSVSEVMRILGAGNVGIGTTAPIGRLHSYSADSTMYPLAISGTTKGIRFETNANSAVIRGVDTTLTTSYEPLTLGGTDLIFLANGNTEAMRINSGGNVGIGTTNPLALLHGKGSATGDYLRLWDASAASGGEFTVSMAKDGTESFSNIHQGTASNQLVLRQSGNVGIGTTNPNSLLSIASSTASGTSKLFGSSLFMGGKIVYN